MGHTYAYRCICYRKGIVVLDEYKSMSPSEVAMRARKAGIGAGAGVRLEFLELLNKWNAMKIGGDLVYVYTAW